MINKIQIDKQWESNHFMIYLYLCVANADYNLSDEELEELHKKFEYLNIDDKDFSVVIKEVLQEFKNHTDREMNDFIMDYGKRFCDSKEKKEKILSDLKDIINADGIVKDVESLVFRNIKQMLKV